MRLGTHRQKLTILRVSEDHSRHLHTAYEAVVIIGGMTLTQPFIRNRRGFTDDVLKCCNESFLNWNTNFVKANVGYYCYLIPVKPVDASESVGQSHSSDEVSVISMAKRASIIWSGYFKQPLKNNGMMKEEKTIAALKSQMSEYSLTLQPEKTKLAHCKNYRRNE